MPTSTLVPGKDTDPEETIVPGKDTEPEVTIVPQETTVVGTQNPLETDTPEMDETQVPTTTKEPFETTVPSQTDIPDEDDFSEELIKSITLETELDKEDEADLRVGDEFELYANIYPEELEDSELDWSSSDESVATIDWDGCVTCVGAGKVTFTATATDGSNVTAKRTFTILKAKSKDNYLSKIAFSQGKLTPAFKKKKTKYTLTLSKKMSKVIIKATKSDSNANIKINGKNTNKVVVKLKSGKSKVIIIKVTAENGKTKSYRIKVKRK